MNAQLKNIALIKLLLLIMFSSAQSIAAQYQSHASIHAVAKQFMQQRIALTYQQSAKITSRKLDSRLKLRKCSKALRAFLPRGSRDIGKTTVGVKCEDAKPWSLHLAMTVSMYRNVLVSTQQLLRGDIITVNDVKLASRDLSTLPYGYIDKLDAGIGMKLKRRVQAGMAITPSMIDKPKVISRGQKVTIIAQSGRMQVRMSGKALAHGAIGDRIAVQNMASKQKLEGIVIAAGEIRVEI